MPKRVAEAGEGGANGYGVYGFIRELITEGKDAEFVDNRGRYRLNWPRALDRYADYKAKKNPHFKGTNQNRRKASNSLRSALLNFYKKEGAREYKESKKVNEKDQVVERQFQMPPRVFEALFSNARLSDSNEEQDEQERKRHLSEGGVGGQASSESSSDAGFDESMDLSCDFSGSPEPLVSTSFGNFLTSPRLDEISPDVRTEGPGTHFSDCAFQTQIFDEDSVESAVEEICSESDEISGLMGVVDEIFPASGSVKGGYRFDISLSEPLPENVSSGKAEFEGVGTVPLIKVNPFKLCGVVPASDHPRDVGVKVSSQSGECLGCTCFRYVDEMREMVRQLIHDPEKLSSFLAIWSEECHSLDLNMQFQGDVDATTQAKQKQSVKILELLVYTAAQTGAKQFIEMIFSTSAQRIVFDSYKERATLPEDVARANGHCDLAEYLEDITMRLTKEVDNQPKATDWCELWNAVKNQVYEESKEEVTATESDGNSSDYFADAETSSCGSSEHDDVFTSNSEGKDAAKKDGAVSKGRRKNQDGWKDLFIHVLFEIIVILMVILLAEGIIASRFSEDLHMANDGCVCKDQTDFIDLVLSRHCFYPNVQNKMVLSQIMELLRQCGTDEEVSCAEQPHIFVRQHCGTNETVTVSRIQRLQCRHHHRYDEVRCPVCQGCPAGVSEKHCIDANRNVNNAACGFPCTVYFLSLHASGGCVVVRNVSINQCAPHSFQPCQLYEKHQDEMTDPKILQQEPGHLSQFYHGDNMQRYQINETFNDVFTFLYQELSTSYLDEIIDVKNEQFADSQCPFYAENLTHRKIYKSFKQCSTFCNRFNYTLIKQTGSDKEPEGLVSIVFHLGLLLFLVTFLISIKIRRLSKGTSQMKQENAVFKANDDTISTCRLKKENHKQILIPQVYGTRPNQELGIIKKSIGDESFPSSSTLLPSYSVFNKSSQRSSSAPIHGLYSGNVSRIKETNMKELQTERIRSWLSSNPNLEELPFAKGF